MKTRNCAARVLREEVEHAFTSGMTTSQIMATYRVTYKYAYEVKQAMSCTRRTRRCAQQRLQLKLIALHNSRH